MVAARASFSLPEAPVPVPGVARRPTASLTTHNGHANHQDELARFRALERHVAQLRSKLGVAIGISIALGCAFVAAVVMFTMKNPDPAPITGTGHLFEDPVYAGPGFVPLEDQAPIAHDPAALADPNDIEAPNPEKRLTDATTQPPVVDRPFDITLLAWPDAELHLESAVDTNSIASLEHGMTLLEQYDQAIGLPERGQELLDAWRFRIEQLRLNGIP